MGHSDATYSEAEDGFNAGAKGITHIFNAMRGTAKLNCPADEAFTSEYVIHKANDAVAAQTRLVITPEEVKA